MPPKGVKKRKVVKEASIQVKKVDEEPDYSDEYEDDDEDETDTKKSSNSSGDKKEDDRVWVQCNTCDKWRALPSHVNPEKLPDIWTCDQNTYDLARNTCDAPEETFKQTDLPLKNFLKVWVKKLKSAERAETRLPPSALTRGRKRKSEVEWIRCCNPACGKWRAILRTIDTSAMLKRLNDNKWGKRGALWFCSMNSWDETTASCAAPQEPLYDCPWNIGLSTDN